MPGSQSGLLASGSGLELELGSELGRGLELDSESELGWVKDLVWALASGQWWTMRHPRSPQEACKVLRRKRQGCSGPH